MSYPDPGHSTLTGIVRNGDFSARQGIGSVKHSRESLKRASIVAERVFIELLADICISRDKAWVQLVGELALCHQFSGDSTKENCKRGWLRFWIKVYKWRFQEIATNVLADLFRALSSIAE